MSIKYMDDMKIVQSKIQTSNSFEGVNMGKGITDQTKIFSRRVDFCTPDISEAEINEVTETLRSGWITTGPRTKLLERRLAAYIECGRNDIDCSSSEAIEKYNNKVVCLNSATAAEELNLRILGIGPGDEVIVPAYTYTATASAVIHCGASVKFVDIVAEDGDEHNAPLVDYNKIADAINEHTKAVILVDLGGIVADYKKVLQVVESKRNCFFLLNNHGDGLSDLASRIQAALGRVAILSDAAHALGAWRIVDGRKTYVGALADFTSFSFHAVKNFTTAEGGASTWSKTVTRDGVVTNDEIYKYYQLLSLHGQSKDALEKTELGMWEYDIIAPWYKYNMTDIMAAIGLRQLDRYEKLLKRRGKIIEKYDEEMDLIGIKHNIHRSSVMQSSNHLYLVRVPKINSNQRSDIIEAMARSGVACNVHYKPLPMMSAYKAKGEDIKNYPNSFKYYENLITLPLHTRLVEEDVTYVIDTFKKVVCSYL